MEFPCLFSPIKIKHMELKNRIVMTAMHLNYTPDGFVNDRLIDFYTVRARGGAGFIIAGGCLIDELGGMSGMIRIDNDRYIPGLKRLTASIKNEGAKIAAQLYQAGRYVHSSMIGGQKPFSASAVRSTFTGETPRALELDEIPGVQDRFAELGSAGYLISQFLSPLTNLRKDRYGGSFENRMRFGIEVTEKVREAVGEDYPILMRLAGNDFMKGGNTNKEARIFASELEKTGVDLFNVTGGWHETRIPQLTMSVPRRAYVYLAQGIKSSVSVPVLASNRINDPCVGEKIIRDGEADLVTMARALIADPELPKKAQDNRSDQIYHCVACNQGCFDQIFQSKPVTCLVNPRAGRERETVLTPASHPKKILVVGGGPAGMKAACTAAERGHRVILAERSVRLGGQLLLNRDIPGRSEMVTAATDLISNLRALDIDILLGRNVDAQFVKDMAPDAVILATGGTPLIPGIKGIRDRKVVMAIPGIKGIRDRKVIMAWDLLAGNVQVGKRVVIVGGNAVGLETALHLAEQGTIPPEVLHFLAANRAETWDTLEGLIDKGNKEVTVVEMLKEYGKDIGLSTRWTIRGELKRLGVEVITGAKAVEVNPDGLEIEKEKGRELLKADSIVIAAGTEPLNGLRAEIRGLAPEIYTIGDAEKPRKALDAIKEGLLTGLMV